MMQKFREAVGAVVFCLLASLLFVNPANANDPDPLAGLFDQQPQFLPVEQAFIFAATQNGSEVELNWTIAEEYYLYADKFQYAVENAEIVSTHQGETTQIEDEFFGVVNVYFFESIINVKLTNIEPGAVLKVRYQGCAQAGLCYQPVSKSIPLQPDQASAQDMAGFLVDSESDTKSTLPVSQQDSLAAKLQNESLLITLAVFFALGVGLAFTPCVFPMFPILSGIIAGQKQLTARKGLYLAFIYVQGMALTYSLLGLVVASFGVQFQAALQHPLILILVSVIFVLLAGAMFGWYTLQLPQSWTSKLTEVSNKQKSGNSLGVFVMGALSGLIASPCTTAPLTGALLYVAQTGDLLIGFFTLYVLSLGMGLPLLLIGLSGGKLLPKAGQWMDLVKNVFGFVLLAVPLILFERFVDWNWVLVLAGIWSLLFAAYMHSQYLSFSGVTARSSFWLVSWVSLVAGFWLVTQPLSPVSNLSSSQASTAHEETQFKRVVTMADIEQAVAEASRNGQVTMLDLYADWCVACKEFEAFTFSDPNVQKKMEKMLLLQVDMTQNSDKDLEIMEHFQILGLPTILFFDKTGKELVRQRVTGFMDAKEFDEHITGIF